MKAINPVTAKKSSRYVILKCNDFTLYEKKKWLFRGKMKKIKIKVKKIYNGNVFF